MRILNSLACFALAACVALPARGESALYVNSAPDMRYSVNGRDSRISFDLEKHLYGYGHDYGKLDPCADGSKGCITFDFMALYELPEGAATGDKYAAGQHRFNVAATVDLSLLGSHRNVFRVDVTKDGKRSNSYLFDHQLGVVAIIVPNFGDKEIPESIFFLQGSAGVFAKAKSNRKHGSENN